MFTNRLIVLAVVVALLIVAGLIVETRPGTSAVMLRTNDAVIQPFSLSANPFANRYDQMSDQGYPASEPLNPPANPFANRYDQMNH